MRPPSGFPGGAFGKKPEPLRVKRMTIAAGMLCEGGIVFGADTDESLGELRRRVNKIVEICDPRAMITGACLNAHLMDTAIERIFDRLEGGDAKDKSAVEKALGEIMVGLYAREFKVYPDQSSTGMQLLVAVKPLNGNAVSAWSINGSAVRRMKPLEVVGCGELVRDVADNLYRWGIDMATAKLAMVQLLAAAKKRVQYVGGESCVHYICHDGSCGKKTFRFSPETEDLYEYFISHGRQLMLATGTPAIGEDQFDEIAAKFIADLKWKQRRIEREF